MIVVGVIGISLSAIFAKYSEGPAVITAAYRLLWTVFLMTPMIFCKKEFRQELFAAEKKSVLLCACGGIFLAMHFTSWFESLNQTSVASSTAISCSEVIWVAIGYCLFLRGRVSRMAKLSIAVTVTGSLLIALSDYTAGGNRVFGDLLALLAAIFSACYTLIGRKARATMTTMVYTYIVYAFCCLALCLAVAVQGIPITGYGARTVAAGFLLSVCSTLLGHSIFSWCLKYLSPAFVSATKLCEPVVAGIFALILFQEIPVALQITGGAVTIAGVLLYSRIENREQTKKES